MPVDSAISEQLTDAETAPVKYDITVVVGAVTINATVASVVDLRDLIQAAVQKSRFRSASFVVRR